MLAQAPAFEDALETIFTMTDSPEMMRTFLLDQVPPIISVDVFASCVSGPDTIEATLLTPAGFGNSPGDQQLSVRGRVAAAWALARKRFGEDHTPERKGPNSDSSITNEKRLLILSNFQQRYGRAVPPEDLPSGRTLALAHTAWRKRSAEPIPFSMMMSVKDGGAQTAVYLPIVPGIALAIQKTAPKKNRHWANSIPHYVQTVELLLTAYTMVSTLDEAGAEWLHYDVAKAYLARLRMVGRLNALSDPNQWPAIAECETAMRNERRDRNLTDPSLSLSDLLTLSLEQDKYPGASRFIPPKMPRWRAPKDTSYGSSSQNTTAMPKYASNNEPYNKRQKKEHTTQGPKGNPYMERDFRHKNQRNACSHGLACKYAHYAKEMETIQGSLGANLWVQAADLRSGKAHKRLEDHKAGRITN